MDQQRGAWPAPPAHYKEYHTDPPPILGPEDIDLKVVVYGTPILETYKSQLKAAEEDMTHLYDPEDFDTKEELKKLNMSLLFNFLDMTEMLSVDPTKYTDWCTKIEHIMINMHHLLNLFRPHQARQILIAIMEKQIERRKEFLADLDKKIAQAKAHLVVADGHLSKVDLSPKELKLVVGNAMDIDEK